MVLLFVSIVNQFFTLSAMASEVVRQRGRLESDFGATGQPQHHFMNAGDLRPLDAPRHVIEGMLHRHLLSTSLSAFPANCEGVPFDRSHIYASGKMNSGSLICFQLEHWQKASGVGPEAFWLAGVHPPECGCRSCRSMSTVCSALRTFLRSSFFSASIGSA
ncbi:manganese catalase family protein [Bradyrhizobium shewense]|uniref:manganese catalase family protein n=1 Tax=Bradyrhizobium shewense TaxID=1761772 RepID=UPI001FD87E2B|nr:manganese catalase family protein [Bradyrhizobium shewense]